MSEISQASEDLFFKLRNRFPKISMGDADGKDTVDPEKARFFSFVYTDKESNRAYGRITASLIDGASLKVFFDTAITDRMLPEDKNYWYNFLRELRRMAKSHMLNFDVRDITKDTLSRQDLQYMTKLNPEKKKFKESLEESRVLWQRRGKFSEGTLNNVRINVVHNEKMLENPNNRLLKVDRIFLVNENGEKFLLPFKSVGGAKAMANHVSRGGNPYDSNGQLISRAIAEMRNLSRFTSVTRNRTFESSEAGDVITAAQQMKESIKRHIARLTNNSRSFNESLQALNDLISENSEDLSEVKGWFTQQTYNENLDNYLASAAGAYKKLKEGTMNRVNEAAGSVEKKIMDPNYKLVLKADSGLDKLMISRKYTSSTALLTAILGDIANRMIGSDGDDIANFASLMGDLVSSEGEAFGQRSEPEYNKDKKLAILLAQKYMKDLAELNKNPDYAKVVRKEPTSRPSDMRKKKTESEQFAEEIMSIGEGPMTAPVEINGKQVDVHSLEVVIPDPSDYPDFSDAYFSAGQYTDGTPIDDQDLDDLARTHGDLLHMTAHDQVQGMYDESIDEADMTRRGFLGALGAGLGAVAAGSAASALGAKPAQAGERDPFMQEINAKNQVYSENGPKFKTELFNLVKSGKINSPEDFEKFIVAKARENEIAAAPSYINGDQSPEQKKQMAARWFDDGTNRDSAVDFTMSYMKMKPWSMQWVKKIRYLPDFMGYKWNGTLGPVGKAEIQKLIQGIKTGQITEDAVNEEPNEGNEFSGKLAAAKASGKKEFEVDGKTYPVKEGGSVDKPEHEDSDADDKRWDDKEEKVEETKMSKEISEMRKLAGLPLMENYVYAHENDMEDMHNQKNDGEPSADDKAEYDQEGRMGKNRLSTIIDAAQELEKMLQDDENLPEWVQDKITMAADYIDTVRDYMKSNDVEYTDEAVEEAKKAKPDYLDFDKDGDKKESMKKALADKKKMKESADLTWLQAVAGIKNK